jgi:hypothetical protein
MPAFVAWRKQPLFAGPRWCSLSAQRRKMHREQLKLQRLRSPTDENEPRRFILGFILTQVFLKPPYL